MDIDMDLRPFGFECSEVSLQSLHCLSHETPHWQAVDEVERLGLLVDEEAPRPREHNFRLPEPRLNGEYVGQTIQCDLLLPAVGRETSSGSGEEGPKVGEMGQASGHAISFVCRAASLRLTDRHPNLPRNQKFVSRRRESAPATRVRTD
jgi:hypothetical protein